MTKRFNAALYGEGDTSARPNVSHSIRSRCAQLGLDEARTSAAIAAAENATRWARHGTCLGHPISSPCGLPANSSNPPWLCTSCARMRRARLAEILAEPARRAREDVGGDAD